MPAYPSETRLGSPDEPRHCKCRVGDDQSVGRFARIRQFDSLFAQIRFDGDYSVIWRGNLLATPIRSGDLL